MKHVRVRVTGHGREGEIHPMYDVWANADCIERATALQWNYTGEALGILHYAVGDADAFEATIADIDEVVGYDLLRASETAFYVYVRDATTDALGDLFAPMAEGGLVVVPPIRYHADGTVTLSLFGPDAELQAAVGAVPDLLDVTIERVSGLAATRPAVETRLTERQHEAVTAAVDMGYYDVPRTATHEDVARRLECAPSTAAEHLRKAESTVLSALFSA